MRLILVLALIGFTAPLNLAQEKKERPQRAVLELSDHGHSAAVTKILFDKSGSRLVSVSLDKTVRVWDVASGETQSVMRMPFFGKWGQLSAASLGPDDDLLAVAGFGDSNKGHPPTVFLLSLKEERIVKTFVGHGGSIGALAWSHDGKRLAGACDDHLVYVWEAATGTIAELKGHAYSVADVAFHPKDSNKLLSASAKQFRLWDVGRKQGMSFERPVQFQRVAWSRDGTKFALAGASLNATPAGVEIFEASGKFDMRLAVPGAFTVFPGLVFGGDGKSVVVSAGDLSRCFVGRLRLDNGKGRVYGSVESNRVPFPHGDLAVAGDGKETVAVAEDFDHRIYLWKGQGPPRVFGGLERMITTLGWVQPIPGGKAASRDPVLAFRSRLLETEPDWEQKPPPDFFDHTFGFGNLTMNSQSGGNRPRDWHLWSLEGIRVIYRDGQVMVSAGKKKDAVPLSIPEKGTRIADCTLVGDRRIVVAGFPSGLWLIDLNNGNVLRSFGRAALVRSLATSPPIGDGKRYFAAVGNDNIVRIYDLERSQPILQFTASGTQWIAWTNEGYYAASAFGERLIGWRIHNGKNNLAKFAPASEFRASLYRPDVIANVFKTGSVAEALAVADKARGRASQVADVEDALPPSVTLLKPEASTVEIVGKAASLKVHAQAKSDGRHPVSALRLLVDGRPSTEAGGLKTFAAAKAGAVEGRWTIKLDPGVYRIGVQAESDVSKARTESTRGIKRIDGGPAVAARLPRLHVLAVGVSDYVLPALKLNFARNDADDLALAFERHTEGIFTKRNVVKLVDREVTADSFFRKLDELRTNMTMHDLAVISFAGHGQRDAKGRFFLLPANVDLGRLRETAISGEKLRESLATIPGRIIVMLDACHSGGVGAGPANRAGDASDELLRHLVTAECGVIVMCSSTCGEFSLEGPQWKHGLFTKAVLDGLSGKADDNNDGKISVKELDFYVAKHVEILSSGRQHPVTEVPLTFRSIAIAKALGKRTP